MPDLSAAFTGLTSTIVTHQRETGAGYDESGYAKTGVVEQTQIRASIQPLSGKEFDNLAEGLRDEAQAKVFTTKALLSGDRIIDGDVRYKVLSDDNWQPLGRYSRAILGALR